MNAVTMDRTDSMGGGLAEGGAALVKSISIMTSVAGPVSSLLGLSCSRTVAVGENGASLLIAVGTMIRGLSLIEATTFATSTTIPSPTAYTTWTGPGRLVARYSTKS